MITGAAVAFGALIGAEYWLAMVPPGVAMAMFGAWIVGGSLR